MQATLYKLFNIVVYCHTVLLLLRPRTSISPPISKSRLKKTYKKTLFLTTPSFFCNIKKEVINILLADSISNIILIKLVKINERTFFTVMKINFYIFLACNFMFWRWRKEIEVIFSPSMKHTNAKICKYLTWRPGRIYIGGRKVKFVCKTHHRFGKLPTFAKPTPDITPFIINCKANTFTLQQPKTGAATALILLYSKSTE